MEGLSRRNWDLAVARCGRAVDWSRSRDFGFEPWLGGLAWLSCSFPSAVYLSVDRASGSPVRKGVCESSGMPRLRQNASEMRPDVPLVTLAPRGIFRVPYGTPSDASVIRMFAFGFPIVNSDLSFDRKSSVGAGGLKWGADSLPLFGCVLD
ncbi:hypothetical protein CRG98_021187 [Punica granatum]|uniref:Uncharacterized protein n=1 Tax=Punica granatum TaxID=22663 RepID=A0A2I0JQ50_PUNGR|nr:hypothetical protein CRG98_021187 [Punica granatum]